MVTLSGAGQAVASEGRKLASNWSFASEFSGEPPMSREPEDKEVFSLTSWQDLYLLPSEPIRRSLCFRIPSPGSSREMKNFLNRLDRWLILTNHKYRTHRTAQVTTQNPDYVRFRVLLALLLPKLTQQQQEMGALFRFTRPVHCFGEPLVTASRDKIQNLLNLNWSIVQMRSR